MKDETARDKAIEKVMAAKLRARGGTASAGCPDAEVVAAYFERTLPPQERTRWEAHFDSCAPCQQRIAALVRMDEAGEAGPAHASVTSAARPQRAFSLRWAWAAPLLLVVLVAGLWYTGEFDQVLNRRTETGKPASQSVASPAKTPPAEAEAEKQAGAAAAAQKLKVESVATPPAPKPLATPSAKDELKPAVNAPAPAKVAGQLGGAQVASPAPPSATLDIAAERRDKEREAASASTVGAGAGAPARAITVPPSNVEERVTPKSTTQSVTVTGATGAVESAPPPPPPQAGPEVPAGGGAAGGALAKAENTPAPSAPTPQAPTSTVEAQQLGKANRQKKEARAEKFKPGQSFSAALSAAQPLFGTVKGDVKDASGAAIPGATIIVINTNTNVAKVLTTNEAGEYAVAGLNPGEYTIQAGARGFKTSVTKDIPLQARAARTVDFLLQVGQVTQTVTVEAAAPTLQSASPVWRVGPHGLIQEHTDQGEWETKPSGVSVDLLGISFPSHDVGWAVGQDGTVLRSANAGESWGRVSSPTGEDLVRVRATSAESAEVTTRRGEVFMTTDGATTWTKAETPR